MELLRTKVALKTRWRHVDQNNENGLKFSFLTVWMKNILKFLASTFKSFVLKINVSKFSSTTRDGGRNGRNIKDLSCQNMHGVNDISYVPWDFSFQNHGVSIDVVEMRTFSKNQLPSSSKQPLQNTKTIQIRGVLVPNSIPLSMGRIWNVIRCLI